MTIIKDEAAAAGDWRSEVLDSVRALIRRAAPQATEEYKWKKPSNPSGVPTWSCDGIICTGETYKDKVKLTFVHGAALDDPHGLFNASLDGKVRRAIDLKQGDALDEPAFLALVQAAVDFNRREKTG
ncbi:DUF1801 domain-containing protein [Noviherbaspirillum galbum]